MNQFDTEPAAPGNEWHAIAWHYALNGCSVQYISDKTGQSPRRVSQFVRRRRKKVAQHKEQL